MIGPTDLNLEGFSLNEESNQKASRFKDCFASTDSVPRIKITIQSESFPGGSLLVPGTLRHTSSLAFRYGRASVCPSTAMPAFAALLSDLSDAVLPRAGVAYVHYLSFMLCFGALVLERRLIKPNPNRQDATLMVITDVVYGMAALALLVSGILRVMYFGQGGSFYTENPLFWWKVGLYLGVGGLSLYPTVTYILWAIPLRKGELPQVSEALAKRLAWILNIELVGFALIPLLATLMARGVGLPGSLGA
jgi:putative membrane protein